MGMASVYWVEIGEWHWSETTHIDYYGRESKRDALGMNIFVRVQLNDDLTREDTWVCDSFLGKIGDGHGTWTLLPSQRKLFLWGTSLEYQAKFSYDIWPWRKESTGEVELRHSVYGKTKLNYRVDMARTA